MSFSLTTILKRIAIAYVAAVLLTVEIVVVLVGFVYGVLQGIFYFVLEDPDRATLACVVFFVVGISLFIWGERVYENPHMRSWLVLPRIVRWNLVHVVRMFTFWTGCVGFMMILGIVSLVFSFSSETDSTIALVLLIILFLSVPHIYWTTPVERFVTVGKQS